MLKRFLQRFQAGPGPALVGVHERAGRLFIQPFDRTVQRTAGFWVATLPIVELPADHSHEELGAAIVEALGRSRIDVPVPIDHKSPEHALFKAMGVRSRRASMEGTRYCAVERTGRELRVAPYHNGGSSGEERGFRPLGDAMAIRLPLDASPAQVGEAVRTALTRATIAGDSRNGDNA